MNKDILIDHPLHYAMPSQNLKYVPGDINAIRKNTITKIVNINSSFREEMAQKAWPEYPKPKDYQFDSRKCRFKQKYKSTDFVIHLPTPLSKVVSMKLNALEIPNTLYTFSSELKNNIFSLNVRGLDGAHSDNNGEYIIEIASGNYTAKELCNYLNNMFADTAIWPAGEALGIKADINSIYGRFSFYKIYESEIFDAVNMAFDLKFELPNEERDIKMNFGWIIGYRRPVYIYEEDYNNEGEWSYENSNWPGKIYKDSIMYKPVQGKCPEGFIGEGMVDLTGPKYLFLVVNDFKNNVNNKYTSTLENKLQIPVSNILARISMMHPSNEIGFLSYSDEMEKNREYFGPVTIDKLHIKLVDEYGRIVNLNNNDISMLLEFDCLYNL